MRALVMTSVVLRRIRNCLSIITIIIIILAQNLVLTYSMAESMGDRQGKETVAG